MQQILITGGCGGVARSLRPRLSRPGRSLRLLDQVQGPTSPGEELLVGSIADPAVVAAACAGMDAVVHLAGVANEAPWDTLVSANIDGTRTLLEQCANAGITKVVLASSNHSVGLTTIGQQKIPADAPLAPDSYYGFSKAAIELLGQLYHHRFHMDVTCLRLGRCSRRPPDHRALVNWLSPDDGARLVEAALTDRKPGFRTIWGVSRNTRGIFDLTAGEQIGYHPVDDSECYAAELGDAEPQDIESADLVGGHFATRPLGVRPQPRRRPIP